MSEPVKNKSIIFYEDPPRVITNPAPETQKMFRLLDACIANLIPAPKVETKEETEVKPK